jgi:hypothetical protein
MWVGCGCGLASARDVGWLRLGMWVGFGLGCGLGTTRPQTPGQGAGPLDPRWGRSASPDPAQGCGRFGSLAGSGFWLGQVNLGAQGDRIGQPLKLKPQTQTCAPRFTPPYAAVFPNTPFPSQPRRVRCCEAQRTVLPPPIPIRSESHQVPPESHPVHIGSHRVTSGHPKP